MAAKNEKSDKDKGDKDADGKKAERVAITPPKFRIVQFTIEGTSPLMMNRFSAKAMRQMMDNMAAGSTAKKGKKRDPRNFNDDFQQAHHFSKAGWVGHAASAIRNACIDVCRMTGFKMTFAKMSIFCEADGYDAVDGTPLIRLYAGEPERTEMPVPNANGNIDIRIRPLWRAWTLKPRIRFDEDQFKLEDVANLLARAGMQVGIGEGRAFSKESNGMGFGFFKVMGGLSSGKEAA